MDGLRLDSLTRVLGLPGTRRVALGGLAGSLGALGLVDAQAKKKKRKNKGKKSKSVTKTVSNDTAVAIPGTGNEGKGDPYPLTLSVSGFKKGKIQDVNVTLRGLSHTFPQDIDVLLVAPDGRNAIIFSGVGGSTDVSNVTITLDDQAASALTADPLVSGTFRPTNLAEGTDEDEFPDAPPPSSLEALSTFNGSNPNGTWQLFVFDDAADDTGTLAEGFQLTIKAKVKVKKKKRKKH